MQLPPSHTLSQWDKEFIAKNREDVYELLLVRGREKGVRGGRRVREGRRERGGGRRRGGHSLLWLCAIPCAAGS